MSVQDRVLPNGARWISVYDPDEANFSALFFTQMGEEKERKGETEGMHLLEHLFFRGKDLKDTLRRHRSLLCYGIETDGKTRTNTAYACFSGPHRRRDCRNNHEAIVDAAFRAYTNAQWGVEEVDSERRRVRTELLAMKDSVEGLLDSETFSRMYAGTRYGLTLDERIANLDKLTLSSLDRLRTRVFRPHHLTVVTIGKRTDAELEPAILATFGSIKNGMKPVPPYPYDLPPRKDFCVTLPDARVSQSYVRHTLRAGLPSFERLAVLYVLTDILSAGFNSLFGRELETKRGRTYVQETVLYVGRPEMRLELTYACDPAYLHAGPSGDGAVDVLQGIFRGLARHELPARYVDGFKELTVQKFCSACHDPAELGLWYGENSSLGLFLKHRSSRRSEPSFTRELASVTPRRIKAAMREWLPGMGTVILTPEPSEHDR